MAKTKLFMSYKANDKYERYQFRIVNKSTGCCLGINYHKCIILYWNDFRERENTKL